MRAAGVAVQGGAPRAAASACRSAAASTARPAPPGQAGIEDVLGDCHAFLDAILASLRSVNLCPVARGLEIDHVCFRVESDAEYLSIRDALVPRYGELLVEGMIKGRPISTVLLHEPLRHRSGLSVRCVEVPAVKKGSPYASGLEHAELVVGAEEDGVLGTEALRHFLAACRKEGVVSLPQADLSGAEAVVNADVSLGPWEVELGGVLRRIAVKLHARPLDEVVAYEVAHGLAKPPPPGYFANV